MIDDLYFIRVNKSCLVFQSPDNRRMITFKEPVKKKKPETGNEIYLRKTTALEN